MADRWKRTEGRQGLHTKPISLTLPPTPPSFNFFFSPSAFDLATHTVSLPKHGPPRIAKPRLHRVPPGCYLYLSLGTIYPVVSRGGTYYRAVGLVGSYLSSRGKQRKEAASRYFRGEKVALQSSSCVVDRQVLRRIGLSPRTLPLSAPFRRRGEKKSAERRLFTQGPVTSKKKKLSSKRN